MSFPLSARTVTLLTAGALLWGAPLWSPPLQAQGADSLEVIKGRFVGHYELVKYESYLANGQTRDMDYVGRIMYDEHGNMSAIGMPRSLPTSVREDGAPPRGGFAYFGSVRFDLEDGIIVHEVEGSPTRGTWVGEDNIRYFELTDDGLLKLSLKDAQGRTTGTLTWRRIEG